MKGLAESSPFHLITNPHVINWFIFGRGVVIYYLFSTDCFKCLQLKKNPYITVTCFLNGRQQIRANGWMF